MTWLAQPGELRDIVGPVAMPPDPTWPAYALAAAICIALAGAAFLGYRWYARRPRALPPEPPRPPHETALEQIKSLASERDPQRFWDGLAGALRDYAGARFELAVADATSSELLAALHAAGAPHREILHRIFTSADLARFAAHPPDESEAHAALAAARRFVLETAPEDSVLFGARS